MPSTGLSFDWVKTRLIDNIDNRELLDEAIAEFLILKKHEKLRRVPASSMQKHDVMKIFQLVEGGYSRFEVKHTFEIPNELNSVWEKSRSCFPYDEQKEALSRCFINLVLIYCISDEKIAVENETTRNLSADTSVISESLATLQLQPKTPDTEPAPEAKLAQICLSLEKEISEVVTIKGQKATLNGFADYTIGYKADTYSSNLIIIEAKKEGWAGSATGQLLAYMAMVHKRRKEDAKENCLVYGVAADGLYYQFWRIENSSIVLHGPMWNWESEIDRRLIYSTFRSIIRTTLVCSPTTSPVKPEKQKQINAQLAKSYPDLDFGVVESWQEWIVEVDDEDDLVH